MGVNRIIVSVTNDLSYDQRVDKVCQSLHDAGYDVLLVGRKLQDSLPLNRIYKTKRIKLLFNHGFLFYAAYNLRLFFYLLFKKVDVLHSNDLDTLLANWLIKFIRRKELIYDSHEYFTGVPEIQHKPIVKLVWSTIERVLFPKLKYVFTVNNSIAELYLKKYGVKVNVLRNLPTASQIEKNKNREDLEFPNDKKIVIIQGAGINVDRGAEELLEAIALSDNLFLCIAGSGDVIQKLKKRCEKEDLKNKVIFTGKLPYKEMMQFTLNSDVGMTLDKSTNINYEFSLPNKIFDYIKAGIPVVSSNLKELNSLITKHQIGLITDSHEPKEILKTIQEVISHDKFNEYKRNIEKLRKELIWEKEVIELVEIYSGL